MSAAAGGTFDAPWQQASAVGSTGGGGACSAARPPVRDRAPRARKMLVSSVYWHTTRLRCLSQVVLPVWAALRW